MDRDCASALLHGDCGLGFGPGVWDRRLKITVTGIGGWDVACGFWTGGGGGFNPYFAYTSLGLGGQLGIIASGVLGFFASGLLYHYFCIGIIASDYCIGIIASGFCIGIIASGFWTGIWDWDLGPET